MTPGGKEEQRKEKAKFIRRKYGDRVHRMPGTYIDLYKGEARKQIESYIRQRKEIKREKEEAKARATRRN